MEIRRVQFTGGSSYAITLPKHWVQDQKIKKNEALGVVTQTDGTLLISKNIAQDAVQRTKEFDLAGISEPTYLFRLLIAAYITGYTTTVIRSKQRFPPFVRMVARDFCQMTIGQEVIEESGESIVLKDLLNPAEMPFENTIKRMFVIVKTMHEDAMTALWNKNGALIRDVSARDNDVDRLHWLVARQTNMLLHNVQLSKKMGVSAGMAVHYYIVSRIIERVGDHAERIVNSAYQILERDIDPLIKTKISRASELSLGIFDRSIVSFFDRNMKNAHRNIESLKSLDEICGEINNLVLQQETSLAIALGYIAESIRRSGEYAADISENVINYLVEENWALGKRKGRK